MLCVKLKVSVEVCRRMGERRWRVACRAGTEACGEKDKLQFYSMDFNDIAVLGNLLIVPLLQICTYTNDSRLAMGSFNRTTAM